MSHDRFYRPILSADISAINLAVELVLISPRKSADKIGRFYRSSIIGLTVNTMCIIVSIVVDYFFGNLTYFAVSFQ